MPFWNDDGLRKNLGKVPWALVAVLVAALASSLFISISPLCDYAVNREVDQSEAARKAVESNIEELLYKAVILADITAQDSDLREKLSAALAAQSSRATQKLLTKVSGLQGLGQLQFLEIVRPDGKVFLSSGLGNRIGADVSDWSLFKETTP